MVRDNKVFNIQKMKRNAKIASLSQTLFKVILLIGLSFVILFPLLILYISSVTDYGYLGKPNSIWIPQKHSLLAYKIALGAGALNYSKSLVVSILYALSLASIQVFVSAFVGYGFSRLKFKGHNILFGLVILTIIMPSQVLSLPQYLYFGQLGMSENILSIYLLAIFGQGLRSGLFVFLFRQFFKGLPEELEEAAFIDGCGFFKTFFKIMLPTAGSVMLTVFVFSFVWNYSDTVQLSWFAPTTDYLITNNLRNKFILNSAGNIGGLFKEYTGIDIKDMNPLFIGSLTGSAIILYILPLAIFYFIVQRKLVQGFERSGITGQ